MSAEKLPLLITGASGRIGSKAAKEFSKDYQVIALDICPLPIAIPGVDFIYTDISSKISIKEALNKVEKQYGRHIASAIHLAAYYNFTGGGWKKYDEITIQGTRHLLEACQELQLEQFIFSSTMLVYAPCNTKEKIKEDSPLCPKWEYPLSKVKTEELIHALKGNSSTVILRIAGIYDDGCHSIPLSQEMIRIYNKEFNSHFFPGNLHHGASFLHMDDLIASLRACVEKRNSLAKEEVFVLGEPTTLSYLELQKIFGTLIHGKPWTTVAVPKWAAKIGATLQNTLPFFKKTFIKPWMIDLADDHYVLDISKAEKILGFKPKHSLKESLPKMVEELKKNPQMWISKHKI